MITDYGTSAAALYDGGWRATDKDALKKEYDLTDEETEKICNKLEEIDQENKKGNE